MSVRERKKKKRKSISILSLFSLFLVHSVSLSLSRSVLFSFFYPRLSKRSKLMIPLLVLLLARVFITKSLYPNAFVFPVYKCMYACVYICFFVLGVFSFTLSFSFSLSFSLSLYAFWSPAKLILLSVPGSQVSLFSLPLPSFWGKKWGKNLLIQYTRSKEWGKN